MVGLALRRGRNCALSCCALWDLLLSQDPLHQMCSGSIRNTASCPNMVTFPFWYLGYLKNAKNHTWHILGTPCWCQSFQSGLWGRPPKHIAKVFKGLHSDRDLKVSEWFTHPKCQALAKWCPHGRKESHHNNEGHSDFQCWRRRWKSLWICRAGGLLPTPPTQFAIQCALPKSTQPLPFEPPAHLGMWNWLIRTLKFHEARSLKCKGRTLSLSPFHFSLVHFCFQLFQLPNAVFGLGSCSVSTRKVDQRNQSRLFF